MASKRARWWYVALLVIVVLYVAYRFTLHCMVEAKLDEIRKQGYPVTLAELDKWYPQPPPGKNAADVYEQAFKLFTPKQASDTNLPIVGDAKLPRRGEVMNEGMKQAVSDYLAKNGQALALLHQFTTSPQCRYPVDLTRGYAALVPHLTDVRRGVRLLLLEAVLHVERGESEQVAQSVLSSLALANSVAAEPIEISQTMRMALCRSSSTELEQALSRISLSDPALQKLNNEFSTLNVAGALVRGYSADRCLSINYCAKPYEQTVALIEGMSPPDNLKLRLFLLRVSGCIDIFLLRYLDAMDGFLSLCQLPSSKAIKQTKNTDPPHPLIDSLICMLTLGSDGKSTIQLAARIKAQLDICRVSLAIERYRLVYGKLPDKLDNLLPNLLDDTPIDPFTGQPPQYKKLAKGYVVYSVGENGKDDGGDEKKDITFTVER